MKTQDGIDTTCTKKDYSVLLYYVSNSGLQFNKHDSY